MHDDPAQQDLTAFCHQNFIFVAEQAIKLPPKQLYIKVMPSR